MSGQRWALAALAACNRQHHMSSRIRCARLDLPSASFPACSAGVERSVLLWQPKGNVSRSVGELAGHTAGVCQLVVADEQSQVRVPAACLRLGGSA